tara:strand:+ start:7551 stop:8198 length:648 start_codon:yes stop_codon:yes gene_type:complete
MINNTILNIFLSYLIGSFSGSLFLGKLKGVDIRKHGSGNAGGTNAFRTQGFVFALGVLMIDILKGYICAKYISYFMLLNSEYIGTSELNILLCGLSAIIGHVYPVYHKFKGGKGAGAAIGMLLALHPTSVGIALLHWIIILILTGFVGFGTMVAASSIPIYLYISGENLTFNYYPILSIFLALFIIFTHRSNILRMINGNENQFEKAMIIKKLFN